MSTADLASGASVVALELTLAFFGPHHPTNDRRQSKHALWSPLVLIYMHTGTEHTIWQIHTHVNTATRRASHGSGV